MKAKIKTGHNLLFEQGCHFNNIKDSLIINFAAKGTFRAFKQRKNHLFIETTGGIIDIVFTGIVPKLEIESYDKCQLILNRN